MSYYRPPRPPTWYSDSLYKQGNGGETMDFFRPPLPTRSPYSDPENPHVFLDLSMDGSPAGRMVFELYANVVPKAAENFRAFCTGERGIGPITGKPLHYKGTTFYRIVKHLIAHGGDITGKHDFSLDGESIYGKFFEDENFNISHNEIGTLTYACCGSHTNGCRFLLLFEPQVLYDGIHVAFGKVVEGLEVLKKMEEFGNCTGTPSGVVKIEDCGQLTQDEVNKLMGSIKAARYISGDIWNKGETMSCFPPPRSHSDPRNPHVFLDVSMDGSPAERMVIELYANVVPKAAENFRAFCTGERGIGPITRKPLHYKGTTFYSIVKHYIAQGGDIIGRDSQSMDGESIYGEFFEDENFFISHNEIGTLTYGKCGSHTNGCRFYILFEPQLQFDGLLVAFGKVVKGLEVLKKMEEFGKCTRNPSGKPSGVVKIEDCGQLTQNEVNKLMVSIKAGKDKETGKRAFSSDESSSSDGREKNKHVTGGSDKEVKAFWPYVKARLLFG